MTEVFRGTQDGIALVGLRNEQIEIAIAPELGGKIVRLVDRRARRDWIWHPGENLKLFRNAPGDRFENSTMVGADECFPSVAACNLNGHAIPDHGEVWSIAGEKFVAEEGEICVRTSLRSLPLDFSRGVRAKDNVVELRYGVRNRSEIPQYYLWAFHPLMRIEEGDQIELSAEEVRVETTSWPADQRGDWWSWPAPRRGIDLAKMNLGTEPAYAKCFIEGVRGGQIAIKNARRGERIGFEFESSSITAIGLWLTRGGWNGYHHVAIEPTNAPADSLADAMKENLCQPIAAGESVGWSFRIIVGM